MKNYGEQIAMYRKAAHLSQKELAERLGVSDKTISSWERGRTEPNMEAVTSLSKILDCSISDIMGSESLNTDRKQAILNGMRVMPKQPPTELFDLNTVGLLREIVDNIENNPYYTDAYSQELAQFAHDNPSYRVLFDASRKVKPENIAKVMAMLKIMGDDEE